MMEEKNLLKEITFLSRLIDQHKSQLQTSFVYPAQKAGTKLQPAPGLSSAPAMLNARAQTQRHVVLRKSSLSVRVANPTPAASAPGVYAAPPAAVRSVHINPNFFAKVKSGKESAVHVNPNFFKKTNDAEADVVTLMCRSVHINPRLLSSTQNSQDGRPLLLRKTPEKLPGHKMSQKSLPHTGAHSDRVVAEKSVHMALADVSMKKTGKCVQIALRENMRNKVGPAVGKQALVAVPREIPNTVERKITATIDETKKDAFVQNESGVVKEITNVERNKTVAVIEKELLSKVNNISTTVGVQTAKNEKVTIVTDRKMAAVGERNGPAVIDNRSSLKKTDDEKASTVGEKMSVAMGKKTEETSANDARITTATDDKKMAAAAVGEKKLTTTSYVAGGAAKCLAPPASETKQPRTLSKSASPSSEVWGPATTPTLASPLRPPSARRRYVYRSKTKLVKATAAAGGGARAVRTPLGSTLLALSRTKLVRLPGRTKRQSGGGSGAALMAVVTPPSHVPGSRVLCTPAGSTLLALSRTKLVRLPGRARRLSTPKSEVPPTSSAPASSSVSTSSFTTSPAISSTVTTTHYRLRRSSSSVGVQSPVVRLARKVCSKYRYRSLIVPAVTSTFRLDRRRGKPIPRRTSRLAWSAGGSGNRYKVDHRADSSASVPPPATLSATRVRGHLLLSPLRRPGLSAFGNRVWARTATSTPKVALSHKRLSKIGSFPGSRNYQQNSALVRIGGLLYKSSRNKLILSKTPDKAIIVNIKPRNLVKKRLNVGGQVVYVRGDKFIMDSSGKTMQRVADDSTSNVSSALRKKNRCLSRIDIGGVTFIKKSPNVLVRTNTHKARNVLSTAKQKSIAFLAQKMRKINTPCLFYRRFGRCPRLQKGRCEHVHDPKYIDICKKFLQGKCSVDGCLLSHNVGPEKMPTCRFFLEACCVRDNCPYLHVKVNDRAPICRNFLQGYCAEGPECLKRHIALCPEFDEKGSCLKGKYCPYPHSTAPHRHQRATCSNPPSTHLKREEDGSDPTAASPLLPKRKRYYEDLTLEESCYDLQSGEVSNEEDTVGKGEPVSLFMDFSTRKRDKIGDLPSFIALE